MLLSLDQQSKVRLDWDNITWDDCRQRISQIKQEQLVQSIELRFSPRSGFHIIVCSYHNIHITRIWYLRRLWGDDGNRLCMDILHYPAYYRDVLFQRKGDDHEEWICTYTRFAISGVRVKLSPSRKLTIWPLSLSQATTEWHPHLLTPITLNRSPFVLVTLLINFSCSSELSLVLYPKSCLLASEIFSIPGDPVIL